MRCASASLASSISTAMISAAPARRAPCTAESPTAPQPITMTVSARPIRATLSAAPTPVITPQPIRQARSNGMLVRNRDRLLVLHDAVFAEGCRGTSGA